jgi:hypothetical protein
MTPLLFNPLKKQNIFCRHKLGSGFALINLQESALPAIAASMTEQLGPSPILVFLEGEQKAPPSCRAKLMGSECYK